MTAAAADVIEMVALGKSFPDQDRPVVALDDINLTVRAGEFVSLLGPSGCGKSTLLRVIADLAAPTSGTIAINGKAPAAARSDRDYGMVFQQPGLFDWRTVSRNIELPLKIMGVGPAERKKRAAEMLALVRLSDVADRYPWQLSGGMQQRVAMARALSFRPSLLLMDEPLGALDEMNREYLQGELLRIWADTGTTIVFVTHSVTEAVFLSTRVCVMSPRPGRIVHEIEIDLPRPRTSNTRSDHNYYEQVTNVREALHGVLSSGPLEVAT